jgi:hypothetical protein
MTLQRKKKHNQVLNRRTHTVNDRRVGTTYESSDNPRATASFCFVLVSMTRPGEATHIVVKPFNSPGFLSLLPFLPLVSKDTGD